MGFGNAPKGVGAVIGKRLKELRTARGMTQAEFGKLIGVGKSAVSQYESGARAPDTAVLRRVAGSFGVTTDWLLGLDEPPEPVAREPRAVYSAVPQGKDRDLERFLDELSRRAGAIDSPEDRHAILEMARYLAQKGKEGTT